MARSVFQLKENAIAQMEKRFKRQLDSLPAYFEGVLFPQYQRAQARRWQTENASEGSPWLPLSPEYAKQKRKRFASYPGSGRKMMIATNRLFDSATGTNASGLDKKITKTSMKLSINRDFVTYSDYAGKTRPFMRFGSVTKSEMKKGIREFLRKGLK